MLAARTPAVKAAPARARPAVAFRAIAPVAPSRARATAVVVKAELKVGDSLTDSSEYYRVLRTSDNKSVALANYRGKQPVVLFFYPKAATPGCTKEACAFRDSYAKFVDAGAAVFGISSDSPEENASFAKANNLPYPLLSDSNSILRKTFGIKGDLLGLLPGRQTYVFDKNGKCLLSFNDQFQPEAHVEKALAAIKVAVKA